MFFMLYGLRLIRAPAGVDRGRDAYGRGTGDLTLHAVTEHLWTLESMETLDSQYLSQTLIAQAHDVAPQSDRAAHLAILAAKNPGNEKLAEWESQLQENAPAWSDLARAVRSAR